MNSKLLKSSEFILKSYTNYKYSLRALHNSKPFIVGVCGPQGSGKSTLAGQLVNHLSKGPNALKVITMSLDDFYYGYDDLKKLKEKHNCFTFQSRGPPGTHDVSLITKTLDDIDKLNAGLINSVRVPVYNKSYRGGLGDREPYENWALITTPIDMIIFEGWMVGFNSLNEGELDFLHSTYQYLKVYQLPNALSTDRLVSSSLSIDELRLINSYLEGYTQIWQKLNCFIQLDVSDLSTIYKWRIEQEVNNKQGLSQSQVIEFVKRFMPTYELCLPKLRWLGLYNILQRVDYIDSANICQHLVLQLDNNRNIEAVRVLGRSIQYYSKI
jgi:D-glycerate 3-kinase